MIITAMDDILWALEDFRSRRITRYALCNAYYVGDHRLQFATPKFRQVFGAMLREFADNFCESVVDIPVERLEITGFSTDQAKTSVIEVEDPTLAGTGPTVQGGGAKQPPATTEPVAEVKDPLAEAAWNLWERESMDLRADEVHREMIKTGDGFVIVWPDEDMDACIYPQYAHEMAVRYSKDRPDELEMAAKLWFEGTGRKGEYLIRLNLYTDQVIRKYISRAVRTTSLTTIKPADFSPYAAEPRVDNPYQRVPVFHFPNKAYARYGFSDLLNVIPLQDALNKTICDMLIAEEFQSFRQRYVIGLDVDVDETTGQPRNHPNESGADRFLAFGDPDIQVGEFGTAELTQFTHVANDFIQRIAQKAGIPPHYFYMAGEYVGAGEALKTSEIRFTRRMGKHQSRAGKQWEEIVKFALAIDGEDVPEDIDFNAVWLPVDPRSDSERMDVLLKKKEIGVPDHQLQKEAGYDDDEIKAFAEIKAAQKPVLPAPTGDPAEQSTQGNTLQAENARARRDAVVPSQNQNRP